MFPGFALMSFVKWMEHKLPAASGLRWWFRDDDRAAVGAKSETSVIKL
jgi:hypothetical protein